MDGTNPRPIYLVVVKTKGKGKEQKKVEKIEKL